MFEVKHGNRIDGDEALRVIRDLPCSTPILAVYGKSVVEMEAQEYKPDKHVGFCLPKDHPYYQVDEVPPSEYIWKAIRTLVERVEKPRPQHLFLGVTAEAVEAAPHNYVHIINLAIKLRDEALATP